MWISSRISSVQLGAVWAANSLDSRSDSVIREFIGEKQRGSHDFMGPDRVLIR